MTVAPGRLVPSKTKKRPKTSSERGREYRARWKTRLEALEVDVEELRRRVSELEFERTIWHAQALQRRHDVHGSLVQLVRKYFTLFQESMNTLAQYPAVLLNAQDNAVVQEQYRFQSQFLHQIMDPGVVSGDLCGIPAILDQWMKYARSHAQFKGVIQSITVSGPEDSPCVELRAKARGRINGATFVVMFPGVMGRNDALLQKFLDRKVEYDLTIRYLFTHDGRICSESVDFDYFPGLLAAGGTLAEVRDLMAASTISPYSTIHDSPAALSLSTAATASASVPALPSTRCAPLVPPHGKLQLGYLCGPSTVEN